MRTYRTLVHKWRQPKIMYLKRYAALKKPLIFRKKKEKKWKKINKKYKNIVDQCYI
jgi:hypothetical protein